MDAGVKHRHVLNMDTTYDLGAYDTQAFLATYTTHDPRRRDPLQLLHRTAAPPRTALPASKLRYATTSTAGPALDRPVASRTAAPPAIRPTHWCAALGGGCSTAYRCHPASSQLPGHPGPTGGYFRDLTFANGRLAGGDPSGRVG